jgi:hypothetical protein
MSFSNIYHLQTTGFHGHVENLLNVGGDSFRKVGKAFVFEKNERINYLKITILALIFIVTIPALIALAFFRIGTDKLNKRLKVIEVDENNWPDVKNTMEIWLAIKTEIMKKKYGSGEEFLENYKQDHVKKDLAIWEHHSSIVNNIKVELGKKIEKQPEEFFDKKWQKVIICIDKHKNIQAAALHESEKNELVYLATSILNLNHADNKNQVRGSGSAIMQYLIEKSNRENRELFLSSADSAEGFYEKFGFVKRGERHFLNGQPMVYSQVPVV